MKSGIYIHIPFCQSRCIYCGFYSSTHKEMRRQYVDALLKEMSMRKNTKLGVSHGLDASCYTDTIYIGGGTPSTLPVKEIERILNGIRDNYPGEPREVTMEMNPDDIDKALISAIKTMGVNRISMGIQTFSDNRLHFLRRRHSAEQAIKAVDTVRHCGIDNVSIDLMFGFPNETIDEWTSDIKQALSLEPSHISAYCLMYEEGTPLYHMLQKGKVKQIDDEIYLAMYTILMDQLTAKGYEHYEISNFARKGYRSIHNSSYWNDTPYLGFGASAHSYLIDTRCWNVADIKEYIESITNDRLPQTCEIIDQDTHYNDLITTALRTHEGLDLNILSPEYKRFAIECADPIIHNGLLEIDKTHIRLTRKGLFVSDMVMSDMMKV